MSMTSTGQHAPFALLVSPPITKSDVPVYIDVDEARLVGIGGNSLTHVLLSLRLNISFE